MSVEIVDQVVTDELKEETTDQTAEQPEEETKIKRQEVVLEKRSRLLSRNLQR